MSAGTAGHLRHEGHLAGDADLEAKEPENFEEVWTKKVNKVAEQVGRLWEALEKEKEERQVDVAGVRLYFLESGRGLSTLLEDDETSEDVDRSKSYYEDNEGIMRSRRGSDTSLGKECLSMRLDTLEVHIRARLESLENQVRTQTEGLKRCREDVDALQAGSGRSRESSERAPETTRPAPMAESLEQVLRAFNEHTSELEARISDLISSSDEGLSEVRQCVEELRERLDNEISSKVDPMSKQIERFEAFMISTPLRAQERARVRQHGGSLSPPPPAGKEALGQASNGTVEGLRSALEGEGSNEPSKDCDKTSDQVQKQPRAAESEPHVGKPAGHHVQQKPLSEGSAPTTQVPTPKSGGERPTAQQPQQQQQFRQSTSPLPFRQQQQPMQASGQSQFQSTYPTFVTVANGSAAYNHGLCNSGSSGNSSFVAAQLQYQQPQVLSAQSPLLERRGVGREQILANFSNVHGDVRARSTERPQDGQGLQTPDQIYRSVVPIHLGGLATGWGRSPQASGTALSAVPVQDAPSSGVCRFASSPAQPWPGTSFAKAWQSQGSLSSVPPSSLGSSTVVEARPGGQVMRSLSGPSLFKVPCRSTGPVGVLTSPFLATRTVSRDPNFTFSPSQDPRAHATPQPTPTIPTREVEAGQDPAGIFWNVHERRPQ